MIYCDTSALVKLVILEAETTELTTYLQSDPMRASSVLTRVELIRAARRYSKSAERTARSVLSRLDLVPLDAGILEDAATLEPVRLRSLDALHLATARLLGAALTSFVCYDNRLADAAAELGMTVRAPGIA